MKYVTIDLEMNPLAKEYKAERAICCREVIEIGAILLDENYQEIDSFKTFVKPQFNDVIKPHIQKLTNISNDMVENAPFFEEALQMFCSWCKSIGDDILLYQWSESDIEQIRNEMNLKGISSDDSNQIFLSNWFDLQREFGDKLNLSNAVSLKNAVMYAGIDFEGTEHDDLDDARNTAILLKIIRIPELCEAALKYVLEALNPAPISTSLGSMIDFTELGFIA